MEADKVALFSGRFDLVHVGHIKSMQLLGQRYRKVIIVILDYREQHYSVTYRKQIIQDILDNSKGNYEVVVNKIHFGKITKEQLDEFNFDVYVAANQKVLKHVESLGCRVEWVDRPYAIDATTQRLGDQVQGLL